MHSKRLITGLAALPVLFLVIFKWGPGIFALVVGGVGLIALWEYFRIAFADRPEAAFGPIPLLGYASGAGLIWAAAFATVDTLLLVLGLNLTGCGLMAIWRFKHDALVAQTIARQVLGVAYIPLFLSCLVLVRGTVDGVFWIFTLLAVVFVGDTSAYYTGRHFGGPKLCPSVSPGKTVSGSLGGLAGSAVAGMTCKILFSLPVAWWTGLLFFITLGAVGQVGDLFESIFKRSANIKDSGNILPGHGGLLDRIDALLFAAPTACFFIRHLG